nr:MAG TPA: hypothetical protein [Caudoviricetes sp.]
MIYGSWSVRVSKGAHFHSGQTTRKNFELPWRR